MGIAFGLISTITSLLGVLLAYLTLRAMIQEQRTCLYFLSLSTTSVSIAPKLHADISLKNRRPESSSRYRSRSGPPRTHPPHPIKLPKNTSGPGITVAQIKN
jgi:hypothetical protein